MPVLHETQNYHFLKAVYRDGGYKRRSSLAVGEVERDRVYEQ